MERVRPLARIWSGAAAVLFGAAAVLLAAAVVPWRQLVHLAGGVPVGRLALGFAALACAGVAALLRRRAGSAGRAVREEPRPLEPISWWWMLAAAAAVAAVVWITTVWMLGQASQISDPDERTKARIDAVRTGLATGAGAGVAVTLMLAFRRQHHTEATAGATEHDATERRITELYTKAVEQLGSGKAAVRLGGLYALERLANDAPRHRQVVVDVICAYLRMPYTPPADHPAVASSTGSDADAPTEAEAGGGDRAATEPATAPGGPRTRWPCGKSCRSGAPLNASLPATCAQAAARL